MFPCHFSQSLHQTVDGLFVFLGMGDSVVEIVRLSNGVFFGVLKMMRNENYWQVEDDVDVRQESLVVDHCRVVLLLVIILQIDEHLLLERHSTVRLIKLTSWFGR